jgi:DNA ligase-1
MLRQPSSLYIPRRSTTLLKVKTFYDAEARVVDYEPGKGKYDGLIGALVCEMESGKRFGVGSGLTDERRANAPKVRHLHCL